MNEAKRTPDEGPDNWTRQIWLDENNSVGVKANVTGAVVVNERIQGLSVGKSM